MTTATEDILRFFPYFTSVEGEAFQHNDGSGAIAPPTGSYLIVFFYGHKDIPNQVLLQPNSDISVGIGNGRKIHLLRFVQNYIPIDDARKIWDVLMCGGWRIRMQDNPSGKIHQ